MAKLFAFLFVLVTGTAAIVLVIMGLQYLSWRGPEWVMMESKTNPGTLILGAGPIISGLVAITAVLVASIAAMTATDKK